MTKVPSPIRPTAPEAIALARALLRGARFGALGVIDPDSGSPHVTRIAVGTTPDGQPMTLISDLSAHTKALRHCSTCSLLVGEPGDKGDPLTHPRLSLTCSARFVRHGDPAHADLRLHYLETHPKAQLYIDFSDFQFAILSIEKAALNGGFGQAFELSAADMIGG
ncbi:HugZ family pyridoxamine 5'-phosphate oxidase [Pseudogemmobacter sp. W21_MBD1_M6]|uniref:HugZ family pyridoxamine 5'-phosphate oxidase n=1 Tax=Pseudogemmobacter sp. W21_MBD1_M6 TaxID=3240271 RepID=UPI003F9BCEBE